MKIVTILGARPQFIKAGTVSREIVKHDDLQEVIVHTGQHYDANMSEVFFEEMKIPKPHYNLNINGFSHGVMTGQMLEKIEQVLIKEQPDWVLVYGDTNSTLAGALAASKLHIKLAHIEAGLRSFNIKMPEEINRILTDRMSQVLFCPTHTAVKNLNSEAFDTFDCEIINSGDVMYDGAMFYKNLAVKPNVKLEDEYILCTVHRAENTDDLARLKNIVAAIDEINNTHQVIMPMHPRTKAIIEKNSINFAATVIEPVGYLEMIYLINHASMIMTDSGGLQKEAFFFNKPCVTLRDETEWVELVDHKNNVLVGAVKDKILDGYYHFDFNKVYTTDLYGVGNASNIIVKKLIELV